ncbi:MAG: hypothetical protein ACR2RE_27465, partial [Geminicoccaceae bacterium]
MNEHQPSSVLGIGDHPYFADATFRPKIHSASFFEVKLLRGAGLHADPMHREIEDRAGAFGLRR